MGDKANICKKIWWSDCSFEASQTVTVNPFKLQFVQF